VSTLAGTTGSDPITVSPSQDAASHVRALQSARGIAATVVMVHHSLLVFATTGPLHAIAEQSKYLASAAVVFFFVLSGYVLGLSLSNRPITLLNTVRFYIRRGWRIYPALWLGCLMGLAYLVLFHPVALSSEYSSWFSQRFDPDRFNLYYSAMSFAGLYPLLDPPQWSIFVELVGSAFLPIVAFANRRKAHFIVVFLVVLAVSVTIPNKGWYACMYLIDFVMGVSIIRIGPLLAPYLRRWHGIPVAIAGVSYMTLVDAGRPPLHHFLAISSALIICTILAKPGWTILEGRVLSWIGDISYSIYILHFPIMCTLAIGLKDIATVSPLGATLGLVASTSVLTLLASSASYRCVELRGIEWGTRFWNRVSNRISANWL
jgi:peptidoglycan/LPS O-acetylase OafA/YrhL